MCLASQQQACAAELSCDVHLYICFNYAFYVSVYANRYHPSDIFPYKVYGYFFYYLN